VLLIWVSLAGNQFAWGSTTSVLMVLGGVALLALAVLTELKVAEPIIPLHLFRDRTTSLATFASAMVGVAMFGSTVFLSQYFQISRGMSPTEAGLMSVFMVGGLMVSSMLTGRRITRTGRWKRYLVGGMVLTVIGLGLLSAIDETTNLVEIGAFMALVGVGLGATMQNLVLAVQNNTAQSEMGTASAVVAFFRTMGGSVGVSVLGAALGHQVSTHVISGLAALGITPPSGSGSQSVPDLTSLPAPVRAVFEHAFGLATGHVFLLAAPVAAVALVAVLFIREVPLRLTIQREDELSKLTAEAGAQS
jgi:predicted MFS family arabinose efflux permease